MYAPVDSELNLANSVLKTSERTASTIISRSVMDIGRKICRRPKR